ncbi:hypothetical protein ACFT8W_35825 [Streptomyces hygroscopicus]
MPFVGATDCEAPVCHTDGTHARWGYAAETVPVDLADVVSVHP